MQFKSFHYFLKYESNQTKTLKLKQRKCKFLTHILHGQGSNYSPRIRTKDFVIKIILITMLVFLFMTISFGICLHIFVSSNNLCTSFMWTLTYLIPKRHYLRGISFKFQQLTLFIRIFVKYKFQMQKILYEPFCTLIDV